jgi:hypothetical protein
MAQCARPSPAGRCVAVALERLVPNNFRYLQWPALQVKSFPAPNAGVAELADAPDSKSGGRKAVWVRPPPPAPSLPLISIGYFNFAFLPARGLAHKSSRQEDATEPERLSMRGLNITPIRELRADVEKWLRKEHPDLINAFTFLANSTRFAWPSTRNRCPCTPRNFQARPPSSRAP